MEVILVASGGLLVEGTAGWHLITTLGEAVGTLKVGNRLAHGRDEASPRYQLQITLNTILLRHLTPLPRSPAQHRP